MDLCIDGLSVTCRCVSVPVILWDSQVKDGYKFSQNCFGDDQPTQATVPITGVACDEKRGSTVIGKLLKHSSNKAYGTEGREITDILH